MLKVGVVGLGRAGRNMHIPEISQYPDWFKITAVADLAPERRIDLPESVRDAGVYSSFEELLEKSDVDMVTIATRSQYHTAQAIAAMEKGKYVVVDKPVAVSVAEAEQLAEAMAKHPGKCFLRFNRRFEPLFNQIRSIIAEGILGKINTVKLYRHTGFVRRYDWQTLTGCCGGLLNNWGPHLIDQALCFLDSPVADVWSDLRHEVAAGDAEDQIKILLRGENSRVCDIEISNTVALRTNYYEVWGNRGTLIAPCSGDEIIIKYLKPDFRFNPLQAVEGLFPLAYGNSADKLEFIEERRSKAHSSGHTFQRGKTVDPRTANQDNGYTYDDTMWIAVHNAITGKAPYPVTAGRAVEVTRVIEQAKRLSGYKPHTIY